MLGRGRLIHQLGEGPAVTLVGNEHRVVPETPTAPRRVGDGPSPPARRRRSHGRRARRPGQRCGTGPAGPGRQLPAAPRAAWRRCRRRWRARRRSGPSARRARPPSASTSRPVSSATAGSPVAATRAWALSRALSSSVSPVSSTSATSAGRGRSTTAVAEDLGDLRRLVRVGRGQDEDAHRSGRSGRRGGQHLGLQGEDLGDAELGQDQQVVELGPG